MTVSVAFQSLCEGIIDNRNINIKIATTVLELKCRLKMDGYAIPMSLIGSMHI